MADLKEGNHPEIKQKEERKRISEYTKANRPKTEVADRSRGRYPKPVPRMKKNIPSVFAPFNEIAAGFMRTVEEKSKTAGTHSRDSSDVWYDKEKY